MRSDRFRQSEHVEDRRGMRAGGPVRLGGLGLGGLLLLLLLGYLTGADPLQLLTEVSSDLDPGASAPAPAPGAAPDDGSGRFASGILADTEDTWTPLFDAIGKPYPPPTLVLFDDAVSSACGMNSSAVGPFYCPADAKVYIDLAFFRDLESRFGAPGDFAQAYVIAHEVGHHVQNLLGVFDGTHGQPADESAARELSVRRELQADCYAGIWGHFAARRGLLDPGDIEEGLAAAAAIGDDRLQRHAQGYVTPETWTHGSSAQRVQWFRQGFETGDIRDCDTGR